MAGVETIIVGGGIAATAPFTLGAFPYIVSVSPPSVSASPLMSQVTGANQAIAISATGDPQPAATEVLRVKGGIIAEGTPADSTAIGRGATPTGTGSIAIGQGATMSASAIVIGSGSSAAGNGIVIGSVSSLGAGTNNSIVLGSSASATGAGPNIVIGVGSSITNGIGHVAIASSITSGTFVVAIQANVSSARTAVFTVFGTPTTNNQAMFGSPTIPILNVLVGAGDTRTTPATVTWRGTNGSGANNAAGNTVFQAPLNTGNVTVGGDFIIQTGTAGASGSTLQTAATRIQVHGGTGIIDINNPGMNFVGFTNGAGVAAGTLNNAPTAGNPTFWLPVQVAGVSGFIPIW